MSMTHTQSNTATEAYVLVTALQNYFVEKLNAVSKEFGEDRAYEAIEWLRNKGENGGGVRFESRDETIFNRASVNISHVHYDNDESKKLGSASAISTIIHPKNPNVPSMHMHISWTEMKNGSGYWRIMGDLNPSITNQADQEKFLSTFKEVAPELYEEGVQQGDKYFYIPALERHRGVAHYYLENYNSDDAEADKSLAKRFGEAVIDTYIEIISSAIKNCSEPTKEESQQQLAYHSLYLLQVLTLDRGTTSGLMVHNQNDVGIMGSIPSHVSREVLNTWIEKMTAPQDELLKGLIAVLPEQSPSPVETKTKQKLANVVREHYSKHREALALQASGNIVPPTVENHK